MQELSETASAYQMAKLGIQERDFLIATHRRSEAAILAQSEHLTCELQQAALRIDDLHQRYAASHVEETLTSAVSQKAAKFHIKYCVALSDPEYTKI